MTKVMLGAMNCRKPMAEKGMRRAAHENIISGRAVIGPQASSQSAGDGPAVKWP